MYIYRNIFINNIMFVKITQRMEFKLNQVVEAESFLLVLQV